MMFDFDWKKYHTDGVGIYLQKDQTRVMDKHEWGKVPESDWHPVPMAQRRIPNEEFTRWASEMGVDFAIESMWATECIIYVKDNETAALIRLRWCLSLEYFVMSGGTRHRDALG